MTSPHGIHGTPHGTPHRPPLSGVRSVLFVCLGNICRSPLAQGVLEHKARARGVDDQLLIESCGTGHWHIGKSPDPRSIAVARNHGITLASRARQLDPETDFDRFTLVLAMDKNNLRDILTAGCPPTRTALFLAYAHAHHRDPHRGDVPDPYTGTDRDFQAVFALVESTCDVILDEMFAGTIEH